MWSKMKILVAPVLCFQSVSRFGDVRLGFLESKDGEMTKRLQGGRTLLSITSPSLDSRLV